MSCPRTQHSVPGRAWIWTTQSRDKRANHRVWTLFHAKRSRTFQYHTLKFQGLFFIQIYLQPSKMFVESYVLGINTCTSRNTSKREHENTCKPGVLCTLVAQWTCTRVMREHWQQKTHFVSISRILYSVYLKICLHWLSFNLKLISVDIFQSCSIQNQGLSRTKTQFQVLSRPWNRTSEIQGFSRHVRTL